MARGTVKFIHEEHGYGFIAPDSGEREIHFNLTDVETPDRHIVEGQRVEYVQALTPKGPRATHIKTLS